VAKKTRTPPPPKRPVQSPRTRPNTSGPGFSLAGRRNLVIGIAAAVVVAAVAVLAVVVTGKSSSSASIAKTMAAAGCTYKEVPPLPPTHDSNYHLDAPTATSKVKWATFPPSGGGHYQLWAIWNFYTEAVPPAQVVHNEEHGGVIIWWGPQVPAATVAKLQSFYSSSPVAMVGTPIAGLDAKIALTAWTGDPARYYKNKYYGIGHLAICQDFNQKAFAAFRDAFRGKGPEGLPLSADQPGTGPNG
jgi:hypothetical protein